MKCISEGRHLFIVPVLFTIGGETIGNEIFRELQYHIYLIIITVFKKYFAIKML